MDDRFYEIAKNRNKNKITIIEKRIIESFLQAARNSQLEDLHSGIFPSSKIGDFSDVKVVSPYGEIPWNDLSRISDKEMGPLKDSMRKEMLATFKLLKKFGLTFSITEGSELDKMLNNL